MAAVMRSTDPYTVTPGQSVTVTAKIKWAVGNQSTTIMSGAVGIMTSATPTPPTATNPIFITNAGFQVTSGICLGDAYSAPG